MNLKDIADEVQESAKGCQTFEEWMQEIEKFSKEMERQSRKEKKEQPDGVMLSTMHGAKGLEYDTVFYYGCCRGIRYRIKKAVKSADIAEECRMLYVAMTRAKNYLYLMIPKEHNNKKCAVSRFLSYRYKK